MITYHGDNIDPQNDHAPSVPSIAVGLGRMPRFAGQTHEWYPVLAHTLVVAQFVRPKNRIHALLHDAAEAIVGDTPTTWKTEAQKDAERDILCRVYTMLLIPEPSEAALRDVKQADLRALYAEAHVLGHSDVRWTQTPDPLVMAATRGELEHCRDYLEPATAIHTYVAAVYNAPLSHKRR